MRIIIISDIHANIVALESVMTKVKVHRPDVIICLGDLVGYGPHPNEVIEYIRNSNIVCTVGGADERLAYDFARDKRPRAGVADKTLEWTRTVIEEHNLAYLRNLPIQSRVKTPFGSLRFFHASMENTHETVRLGKDPIAEKYFKEHRAKIIAYGKTHVPQIRQGPFGVVVNPGSVGLSLNGEPGADYAVLDITADKVSVEMDKVEYDFAAVAFEIAAWELPSVVGEAVQQGKMPMDDAKMQRDPSKVRIQTKIVVGRQGRSEPAGNDRKVVEDKNLEVVDMSQTITQATPLAPSHDGSADIADITPVVSNPVVSPTLPPTLSVDGAVNAAPIQPISEVISPEASVSHIDIDEVSSIIPATSDIAPHADKVQEEGISTGFQADIPDIADIAFNDIPTDTSVGGTSSSVAFTPISEAQHIGIEQQDYDVDIDDPQEMYDSPARYSDDGMLNLDALEESSIPAEAMSTTFAQNRAEAQLLAEVEAEEQAYQGRTMRSESEVAQQTPVEQTPVQQTPQVADSIEEAIEKRVASAMLELQRQLKQAAAEANSQGMSAEELRKLQEEALDLESLKALVLQTDDESSLTAPAQPTAPQPAPQVAPQPARKPVAHPRTAQAARKPAVKKQVARQPVVKKPAVKKQIQKAEDDFLPSNFFDD